MNNLKHLHKLIETDARARDLDLREAEFAGAILSHLKADGLDLRAADLREAKLCEIRFGGCQLQGAKLEHADWSQATLRMCVLDGAQSADAHFDGARIEDSSAKGANLTHASLRNAKLTETSFERADLREAVFDNAEGDGVGFRGADLGGASLVGVRFDEADFRGANLRGADLSTGQFHSADFRGAILDGTRFEGADCKGSWFDEGAGPYAETTAKTREKIAASPFDEIAAAALRDGLASFPGLFATREGAAGKLLDQFQSALDKLSASADAPPEEWTPWLEPLMNMNMAEHPPNIKSVLDAVCEGTNGLRNILTAEEGPASEILVRLQHVLNTLESTGDQPPEEWKVWLEPLMKMTNEGRPLEGKALLDALAALAQSRQPNPDEPQSSQSNNSKDGKE